jgi:hypothetical protein
MKEKIMEEIRTMKTSFGLKRFLRPALIAVPVVVIVAVVLALQPFGTSEDTSGVIAKAYAAMEKLSSYRLIDDEYIQVTEVSELLYSWHSEFAYSDPGNYYLKKGYTEESAINSTYSHEAIFTDNQLYIRGDNSYQLSMEKIKEAIPSLEKTLELLDLLIEIETLPEESIDGIECNHYRGIVDIEKWLEWSRPERLERFERTAENSRLDLDIDKWMESAEEMWRTKEITYEFWISKEDNMIRQWKYTSSTLPGEPVLGGSYMWYAILHYYDFNEPVEITAPLDNSGELFEGWFVVTQEE